MKINSLLISLLLFMALIPLMGVTQPVRNTSKPEEFIYTLTKQMQSGIYERVINLGYISSPTTYRQSNRELAHNEFTLLFFRFYDFEPTADSSALVGKVFISERYLEKFYNKKYTAQAAYRDDKDGKFMICKLYFDERSLEYRLNIYPGHLLNICKGSSRPFKGTHFNKNRCQSNRQHWQSLKYVVSLPDRRYDDFSAEDDTLKVRQFLTTTGPDINIDSTYLSEKIQRSRADSVNFVKNLKQRNLIREINLRKQIKIFKIAYVDDNPKDIGKTLTLKFSKYALSDDLLEGVEYNYRFIHYDSLVDSHLALRGRLGEFVSRNPVYRSLIVSNEPDDTFVSSIEVTPRLLLSYQNDFITSPSSITKNDYNNSIEQQDKSLKKLQDSLTVHDSLVMSQRQQISIEPRPQKVFRSTLPGQISISSRTSRKTYWVYGGRESKPGSRPKKQDILAVHANQYLRDTIPIVDGNSAGRVWLRGKLSFWENKCFIGPGSKVNWIIDSITVVKNNFLWLRILPPVSSANPKRK